VSSFGNSSPSYFFNYYSHYVNQRYQISITVCREIYIFLINKLVINSITAFVN